MATLLYSATASLDGFIAGPGGDMSWLTEYIGEPNEAAERVLAGTGAILCGHTTFTGDDPNAGTEAEGAFGGRYEGAFLVLTHRPPDEAPDGVTFVGDLTDAVTRAKEAAGDGYVSILGASVAAQCLEAGLLDEVLMLFAPVLLGDGTPIFRRADGDRVRLERRSGETEHWYRVVR